MKNKTNRAKFSHNLNPKSPPMCILFIHLHNIHKFKAQKEKKLKLAIFLTSNF